MNEVALARIRWDVLVKLEKMGANFTRLAERKNPNLSLKTQQEQQKYKSTA